MFKFGTILILTIISYTMAAPKPSLLPAPLLHAPAVVTAQSSQVIARNYNALAAPLIAPAPIVAAPVLRAQPLLAHATHAHVVAPPLARAAPLVASAPFAPYVANPYVASPYIANPYAPYVL